MVTGNLPRAAHSYQSRLLLPELPTYWQDGIFQSTLPLMGEYLPRAFGHRFVAVIHSLARREKFASSSRLALPTPVKFGAPRAA